MDSETCWRCHGNGLVGIKFNHCFDVADCRFCSEAGRIYIFKKRNFISRKWI